MAEVFRVVGCGRLVGVCVVDGVEVFCKKVEGDGRDSGDGKDNSKTKWQQNKS